MADDKKQAALINSILYGGKKSTPAPRKSDSSPYQRPKPAPNTTWQHDLFPSSSSSSGKKELLPTSTPSTSSLAARLSLPTPNAPRQKQRNPAITAHLLGTSKTGDLIDGRARVPPPTGTGVGAMRGYQPPQVKKAIELLPEPVLPPAPVHAPRPVVQPALRTVSDQRAASGRRLGQGVGRGQEMEVDRPAAQGGRFGVKGTSAGGEKRGEGETKVVVEGLMKGTTEGDIQAAFSSHFPTLHSPHLLPSLPTLPTTATAAAASLVAATVLLPTLALANEMVQKFDGMMADGFPLKVYLAPLEVEEKKVVKLSERIMGGLRREVEEKKIALPAPVGQVDLLGGGGIGKMYSDEILQNDPRAKVIVVPEGRLAVRDYAGEVGSWRR